MASEVLLPTTRQFPVDEVVEKILHALQVKDWKAPGIGADLQPVGPAGQTGPRKVGAIRGQDFRLSFGRPEVAGSKGPNLAVSGLVIPGKRLTLFRDESGPWLEVYVGRSWGKDRGRFLDGLGMYSKLYGEKRWYVHYTGMQVADGVRPPVLLHDDRNGREYGLKPGDPKQYKTDEVFAEFTRWLTVNVLSRVLKG